MNNEGVLISVIVPIYNIEKYICECIDSILAQSYKNVEIILVDDGSTDSCPKVCDEYKKKDSRIIVIHKENGGLVSARKTGVIACSGDYICHVDGDDWIHPEYIESFVNIIRLYSPDIICSGEIKSYPQKKILKPMKEREGYYTKEQIETDILPVLLENKNGYYINHANQEKCIKRDLGIKSIMRVNNSISMSEDHACIAIAITNANDMYIMKECLYYYRINSQSMTGSKKVLPWSYPKNLSEHFLQQVDLSLSDLKDQYYRLITHIIFNTVLSHFYSNNSYSKICAELDNHLAEYDYIIQNVHYSRYSRKMMVWVLKKRFYVIFKFYVTIKQLLNRY